MSTLQLDVLDEVGRVPKTAAVIAGAVGERLPFVVRELRRLQRSGDVVCEVSCTREDEQDPLARWSLA